MSIQKKLPLMIVSLVLVALITSGVFTYLFTYNTVLQSNQEVLKTNAQRGAETIDILLRNIDNESVLLPQNNYVIAMLNDVVTKSSNLQVNMKSAHQQLMQSVERFTYYQEIFVADKDGKVIEKTNANSIRTTIADKDYFKKIQSGSSIETYENTNGKITILFLYPVKGADSSVIGSVGATIDLDLFIKNIKDLQSGSKSYAYLTDKNGTVLYDPDIKKVGKIIEIPAFLDIIKKINITNKIEVKDLTYNYQKDKKFMSYASVPNINWVLSVSNSSKDVQKRLNGMIVPIIIFIVIAIIISAFIGIAISISITNPISKLLLLMDDVSEGNLHVNMEVRRKDEFGKLYLGFNKMTDKIKLLVQNMNEVISVLNTSILQLQDSAAQTKASIDETNKTAHTMSENINHQTVNTSLVSDSMLVLSRDIENINSNAFVMKDKSNEIMDAFINGNEISNALIVSNRKSNLQVEKISTKVNQLEKSSKDIGTITEVINGMSEQIKLLALNASIEAARAGEAGKAFSVVATEIGKLSQKSTASIHQINTIIKEVQKNTNECVIIVNDMQVVSGEQTISSEKTHESFGIINIKVHEISSEIEKVTAAISKITQEKDNIVLSIENLEAAGEEINASVEEISATMEEEAKMVSKLSELTSTINEMSHNLNKSSSIFRTS